MDKYILAANVVYFKKTPAHLTKGGIVFGALCGTSFGFLTSQGDRENQFQEYSLEKILEMKDILLCKKCLKIANKQIRNYELNSKNC